MTKLEARFPCPVCLGVKMEKVSLAAGAPVDLVLDHCARCGGVWFEMGEVQQLRRIDQTLLWSRIVRRDDVHMMKCHSCSAHMARTEASCPACGWKVELDCPSCGRAMDVEEQNGMRLDFCRHCKGVWFDHEELTAIWKLEANAVIERRGGSAMGAGGDLMGALMYDPFTMYYGVHAAGYAVSGAAELLSNAPDLVSAAPEVAASLFETIVSIISSIFE